jgi:hypothetical protein
MSSIRVCKTCGSKDIEPITEESCWCHNCVSFENMAVLDTTVKQEKRYEDETWD